MDNLTDSMDNLTEPDSMDNFTEPALPPGPLPLPLPPGPREFPEYLQILVPAYLILVCVVGVTGNSLLVYASYKYTTFGSDRVAVILIRYLGTLDIIQIVFLVIPTLILFLHRWIFGLSGCFVYTHLEKFLSAAHFNLVLMITYHRLARCKWPATAGAWTSSHANAVVLGCVLFAGLEFPLTALIMFDSKAVVTYDEKTAGFAGCLYSGMDNKFVYVQNITDPGVPFTLIILGNVALWLFAIVTTQRVDVKPVLTITVIMLLVLVSYLPQAIDHNTIGFKFKPHMMILDEPPFLLRQISVVGIPIVFTIFNRPFARFIWKTVINAHDTLNTGLSFKSKNETAQAAVVANLSAVALTQSPEPSIVRTRMSIC